MDFDARFIFNCHFKGFSNNTLWRMDMQPLFVANT